MKETPILFSAEMVKAILEGRKTQTRRVVKPFGGHTLKTDYLLNDSGDFISLHPIVKDKLGISCSLLDNLHLCPYGKIGDVLWARETWAWFEGASYDDYVNDSGYVYKASCKDQDVKWKPSIYMPKEACRLFLRITNIRVERLQDISEQDAIAEGIERCKHYPKVDGWKDYGKEKGWYQSSAKSSFKSLWQSINGEQSWNDNPWVWAIEFERIFK